MNQIISVRTKTPYYCTIVRSDRLAELDTAPDTWATFLSDVYGTIVSGNMSPQDEAELMTELDTVLADVAEGRKAGGEVECLRNNHMVEVTATGGWVSLLFWTYGSTCVERKVY